MRGLAILMAAVLLASAGAGTAGAEDFAPYLNISGFYAFDAYTQNKFFLGSSDAVVDAAGTVGSTSDHDAYAIQILRFQFDFGAGPHVKVVVRGDIAQGIWGIDNSQSDRFRPGFSNTFNNKDTNFETHLDWAYLDAYHPGWQAGAKLGRQKLMLGHMLVLDQNTDGLQLTKRLGGGGANALRLAWAKMWEGADGLSDAAAIQKDEEDPLRSRDVRDADVYLASYEHQLSDMRVNLYAAYYNDQGDGDGTTYLPNDLQYFRARFTPNVSEATVLGLATSGTVGSLTLKGELDYLFGKDGVPNAASDPVDDTGAALPGVTAKQLLDVNNGDLTGYNLYLDGRLGLGESQRHRVGVVFGLGSGDDDIMRGDGNINRIRTVGHFYLTEVWEDSVMPDEEGITPQGLGSPVSRGYRELENTTLVQLNYGVDLHPRVNFFAAGTWLKATQKIPAWKDADDAGNADGILDPDELTPDVARANDLGSEIDGKITWKLTKSLTWIFRGGAFFPGDATAYLINGTGAYQDTAWELRTTVKFSWDDIRVGG